MKIYKPAANDKFVTPSWKVREKLQAEKDAEAKENAVKQ
jgi:hypothetical protein